VRCVVSNEPAGCVPRLRGAMSRTLPATWSGATSLAPWTTATYALTYTATTNAFGVPRRKPHSGKIRATTTG
jgi:hypothetical protein